MRRWWQVAIILGLAVLALHAGDDKKKKQSYYLKPDQSADLEAPKVVTARQNCENWALAAGLETLLSKQNVSLDQAFWVMRINYGELCVEHVPSMTQLAEVVNNEFVLDDGRHVRLELQFVPGAPTNIDRVLAGLKQQQPVLLLWRGHPYYLTGATYDEHVGRDGSRIFDVKELRLADTFAKQPDTTFQKGRDNPSEIDGTLAVSVVLISQPVVVVR
jgi:hypothetical protein